VNETNTDAKGGRHKEMKERKNPIVERNRKEM